ncbi:hypothetical protein, partial [Halomonas campaniensis]|uniref:hypothetical protein n=1 Tax=Halomonas campaniensis TaxID=213554 RepID=UPI003970E8D7
MDPLFAAAHNRGYHDINVDWVFGGPGALEFFFVNQYGVSGDISTELDSILRQPNALRITCAGESVAEIVGRAAVHITDEAGKVNVNAAGGHVFNHETGTLERALNQGVSSFEYETRVLPGIGITLAPGMWGMRTGAADGALPSLVGLDPPSYLHDVSLPGYGLVDDNANALLLAFSGRDDSGSGYIDDGLRVPRLSQASRAEWIAGGALSARASWELQEFLPAFNRLGRFEGIDEPSELRLYNPWRNLFAEKVDGYEYGVFGDN